MGKTILVLLALLFASPAWAADGDIVEQTGNYRVALLCDAKTVAGACTEFDVQNVFGWNWTQISFEVSDDTSCSGAPTVTISTSKVSGGKTHLLGTLTETPGAGDSFSDYRVYRYINATTADLTGCAGYTVYVAVR